MPALLALVKLTAQPWNFVVPPGVTSFQFQVIVETNTSELIPLGMGNQIGSPSVDVRGYAGNPLTAGAANGTLGTALFSTSLSMTWDSSGILYVADPDNKEIRRIDMMGNVTSIAGTTRSVGAADGTGNIATFSSRSTLS